MLLRTVWLGGLWICTWLVRPLLGQQGYFPQHGLVVMHGMILVGIAVALLMIALAVFDGVLHPQSRMTQILLAMLLLSLAYFGLMPWWKLQMMLMHALCVLGGVWVMIAPRSVL
ncbi:hypothetical protein [Oceanobacter sp. 4_MG-2023]|uniref:hypothetical protein n=1 Tax=Oceanobacter sp. 4_MG-2023 TaxID=3062623 RepID=UPI00273537AC|nr:hypothetical protein [Oceanobacter sp. 4_MG-2023]MDP2548180.1 hypothetical protein [Oceanobacter sp. 4_MG-2023]